MTSGGNSFNGFPEDAPTREIATKIEKTFLVFSSVAVCLFLEWARRCSINSTHLHPALQTAAHVAPAAAEVEISRVRISPSARCNYIPLIGDRSFSAAGPRLWNDLPPGLRRPGLTFDSFRLSLKTHLFGDRSA